MIALASPYASPQASDPNQIDLPLPVTGQNGGSFRISHKERQIFGFDTETYYTKGYDVRSLGVDAYVADPRFDCYLVSFWGPHGNFVGHPSECPWEEFDNCVWISHNARFDRAVFYRLKEQGIIPTRIRPREWHDSAALAVYLQAPRSLAGAAEKLLGEKPNKAIRDAMKGMQTGLLCHDKAVLDYALDDARLACELWISHSDKWPKKERILSSLTIEQGEYGVHLDLQRVREGIETLTKVCEAEAAKLPWVPRLKPSSPKAFAEACQQAGIPVPNSTSEDDPVTREWVERYGERYPWLKHMSEWRKANRMLKVLETMQSRCRRDGSLPFGLKYFGAIATGRWAGDAGLNFQNFNREALHGVDPRKCLVARPGHKLIIADLSQIEPRVLAWLAGDHELLDKIRNGLPIYQAHAETSMGWKGGDLKKENPRLYLLAKCRVIGLGYGAGCKTFQFLAKSYGLEISIGEAKRTVDDFRKANPRIVSLWQAIEDSMGYHLGSTFFMYLPSFRTIRYFDVQDDNDGYYAATERGGRSINWYGGKLTENLVQATARDVFAEGLLRIHKAGIRILWTVHDEVICEVPEDSEVTVETVTELLAQTPDWIPGLPVAADGIEAKAYTK
ncbi:DNA polymerase [Pelagicoccus sp. SDUM812002]|uniref:DNA polymerase n=1 Tax=Pelagicoccus sp. SDUM812002 TaxID=3041266 RepID=UPI00280F2758|nr:DNA polymerase [Pelagicoccus sp. SDUM812002]MDQ8184280.1 DNA polymerase [Pelagicoccus sp. SDUM812002]